MAITLPNLNLEECTRKLCAQALEESGTIKEAADKLGITRHALRRRITKYGLPRGSAEDAPQAQRSA